MLASLCNAALALLLAAARPRARKPHPAAADESHRLWYWIEDHGDVVIPLLGVAVIALLAYGIRRGMAAQTGALQQRSQRKDRIVRMMRSKLLVHADNAASELGIDRFQAAALLEELEREGTLVQQRVTSGVATYRLKGL